MNYFEIIISKIFGKIELTNIEEKVYINVGTMFDRYEKEYERERPLWWVFDKFCYKYKIKFYPKFAPHVFFTKPWMIIEDIYYEIKYAWQRVFRGYDDRASWGVDSWLDPMIIPILKTLKENKQGIPSHCFPKDYEWKENDENYQKIEDEASKLWDSRIQTMIDGFEASLEMEEGTFQGIEHYNELETKRLVGMRIFCEYYKSLWD